MSILRARDKNLKPGRDQGEDTGSKKKKQERSKQAFKGFEIVGPPLFPKKRIGRPRKPKPSDEKNSKLKGRSSSGGAGSADEGNQNLQPTERSELSRLRHQSGFAEPNQSDDNIARQSTLDGEQDDFYKTTDPYLFERCLADNPDHMPQLRKMKACKNNFSKKVPLFALAQPERKPSLFSVKVIDKSEPIVYNDFRPASGGLKIAQYKQSGGLFYIKLACQAEYVDEYNRKLEGARKQLNDRISKINNLNSALQQTKAALSRLTPSEADRQVRIQTLQNFIEQPIEIIPGYAGAKLPTKLTDEEGNEQSLAIVYSGNKLDFSSKALEEVNRKLDFRLDPEPKARIFLTQYSAMEEPQEDEGPGHLAREFEEVHSDIAKEEIVTRLIKLTQKQRSIFRSHWYAWNFNKEFRDRFNARIGVRRDSAIFKMGKIWGQAKWIMHRELSLPRFHYEVIRFYYNLKETQDPFTPEKPLSLYSIFVLRYYFRRLKDYLVLRAVQECAEILSGTGFHDKWTKNSNFDVVEALEDTRSETFGRQTPEEWFSTIFQSVYVTPRFLQHFDLEPISCTEILITRVTLASIQLGFYTSRFVTGENDKKNSEWVGAIRFSCLVGQGNWYRKNLTDTTVEIHPCSFFVRYTRLDPDDIASPYRLSGFSMTHTHELSLRNALPLHTEEGQAEQQWLRQYQKMN